MVNKVSVVRVSKGLSQKSLATKCGVSQQTISFIENEKKQPSLAIARKIAKSLNCTIDELFP